MPPRRLSTLCLTAAIGGSDIKRWNRIRRGAEQLDSVFIRNSFCLLNVLSWLLASSHRATGFWADSMSPTNYSDNEDLEDQSDLARDCDQDGRTPVSYSAGRWVAASHRRDFSWTKPLTG